MGGRGFGMRWAAGDDFAAFMKESDADPRRSDEDGRPREVRPVGCGPQRHTGAARSRVRVNDAAIGAVPACSHRGAPDRGTSRSFPRHSGPAIWRGGLPDPDRRRPGGQRPADRRGACAGACAGRSPSANWARRARHGRRNVVVTVGAIVFYICRGDWLGFILTMAPILLILLRCLGVGWVASTGAGDRRHPRDPLSVRQLALRAAALGPARAGAVVAAMSAIQQAFGLVFQCDVIITILRRLDLRPLRRRNSRPDRHDGDRAARSGHLLHGPGAGGRRHGCRARPWPSSPATFRRRCCACPARPPPPPIRTKPMR